MHLLDRPCELLDFLLCCLIRYFVLEVFIDPIHSSCRKSQTHMTHWHNQNLSGESDKRQKVDNEPSKVDGTRPYTRLYRVVHPRDLPCHPLYQKTSNILCGLLKRCLFLNHPLFFESFEDLLLICREEINLVNIAS